MTPHPETVALECEIAWAHALIETLSEALAESAAAHHEAEVELAHARAL